MGAVKTGRRERGAGRGELAMHRRAQSLDARIVLVANSIIQAAYDLLVKADLDMRERLLLYGNGQGGI